MGNNLIASSKMQYYPTQEIETFKMLKYFVLMDIPYFKNKLLKSKC